MPTKTMEVWMAGTFHCIGLPGKSCKAEVTAEVAFVAQLHRFHPPTPTKLRNAVR